METIRIDGIEYLTKEQAARRCFDYAKAHPGTTFHNYAHSKVVRRPTTEAERTAFCFLQVTVYEWNKLYTDAPILKTHPELKGLWREAAGR